MIMKFPIQRSSIQWKFNMLQFVDILKINFWSKYIALDVDMHALIGRLCEESIIGLMLIAFNAIVMNKLETVVLSDPIVPTGPTLGRVHGM